MAGRGTARVDGRRSGGRPRASASLFARRVVRLGPPANDNRPAFQRLLMLSIIVAAIAAASILAYLIF